ncbi:hypothetical protein [Endozoicomonas sp. 4G]|uniref:hypothetical protein n=1 Tax=Endozoicomonas sp. 4G TaxID=2872754 RepID=UPI0020787B9D|nr:hypothetical protein [Endozoicomonas sp. 4G]
MNIIKVRIDEINGVMNVMVVESVGNELYLYFQLGGDKMISRIPFDADRVVASGDSALLKFKVSHCHLFDLDTEETLG